MIRTLIILLVGALGVGLYLPDSRALILARAEPLLEPVYQWTTERELLEMGRTLSSYVTGRNDGSFRRRDLDSWLDSEYPQRADRVDSWGTPYVAEVNSSTVQVQSAGPDRVFGTPDDILSEEPRN